MTEDDDYMIKSSVVATTLLYQLWLDSETFGDSEFLFWS